MALAWPEVEDGTSYGTPALKVRKKMLVRLKEDGDSLVMPGVPPDERDMLVERQPTVFYFTDHYKDYPIVLIPAVEDKARDGRAAAAPPMADAGFESGSQGIRRGTYRTTPEMNPGRRRGGLISFFRKQCASRPT
jgi:hypothetical protein